MQHNILRAASFQILQRRFFKKHHVRVRFAPSPTGNNRRMSYFLIFFSSKLNSILLLRKISGLSKLGYTVATYSKYIFVLNY